MYSVRDPLTPHPCLICKGLHSLLTLSYPPRYPTHPWLGVFYQEIHGLTIFVLFSNLCVFPLCGLFPSFFHFLSDDSLFLIGLSLSISTFLTSSAPISFSYPGHDPVEAATFTILSIQGQPHRSLDSSLGVSYMHCMYSFFLFCVNKLFFTVCIVRVNSLLPQVSLSLCPDHWYFSGIIHIVIQVIVRFSPVF